jgi:predicted DNA-binding protein
MDATVLIGARVPPETRDRLDDLARQAGLDGRSEAIRRLIDSATVEDLVVHEEAIDTEEARVG